MMRVRICALSLTLASIAAGGCTTKLVLDDTPAPGGDGGNPLAQDAGPGPADEEGPGDDDDDGSDEGARAKPLTLFQGNPAGCPEAPPEHATACDLSPGEICAYFYDDPNTPTQSAYNECTCRANCDSDATTLWDCYRNVASARADCPAAQPEDGSSCFGLKGTECYYPPEIGCTCPTESGEDSWVCYSEASGREAPPLPEIADASVPVRDMSDMERETFCSWLTAVEPGFPPPVELEPTADGFYPSNSCTQHSYLDCSVALPLDVPASACLDNLALSSCEASVGDLYDCAVAMRSFAPATIGCGPYFAAPGCRGTIFLESSGSVTDPRALFEGCRWQVR